MAPPTKSSSRRKSFLTLTPVDFSLTDGTNIPAPPDTPPRSPSSPVLSARSARSANSARPPTAGGGPLSSHPTSAEDIHDSVFPPTPDPETEAPLTKMSTSTSSVQEPDMDRTDSFRTHASPASAKQNQRPSKDSQQKQKQSVRKLFSLNNLRNSFGSSRTSLNQTHTYRISSPIEALPQPQQQQQPQPDSFNKRQTPAPQMRPRAKSGSWFKHKSGMFMLNGGMDLDAVVEDKPARPVTSDSAKHMKEEVHHSPAPFLPEMDGLSSEPVKNHSPSPYLPEMSGLGSGSVKSHSPAPLLPEVGRGGDFGWDEDMFKR